MTGAFLRVKRDDHYQPIEVERLTPGERRSHLRDRDRDEIMRWMDIVCQSLTECEERIMQLEDQKAP